MTMDPRDRQVTIEFYGWLNAQEAALMHLWAFLLVETGRDRSAAEQLGRDIIASMERAPVRERAGEDPDPEASYATQQFMLDRLERFWANVADQVELQGGETKG